MAKNDSSKKKENDEDEKDSIIPLFFLFGIIITLWGLTWYLLVDKEDADRGTFGDMFGSVNALFSGLALAGIIYTILLQKKELGLQRKELKETKQEFIIQNETLRLQRFENTLFQLISIHHEVIDKLYFLPQEGQPFEKREVIRRAVNYLKTDLKEARKKPEVTTEDYYYNNIYYQVDNIDDAYEFLKKGYIHFYKVRYNQLLSHYYRNIYHIFKFILTTEVIDNSSKKFYSSIVRAQLSSDELFLILYNSLIPGLGKPNFLYLLRELDIMQNFDFNLISEFKFHKEIFETELAKAEPDFEIKKPTTNII